MSKLTTMFILALLLCFSLSYAARPVPNSPMKTQHEGLEAQHVEAAMEESCEGVGEEECLMRRTLVAHVDYIYTQKQNP
ncbi:hypothetical protein CsSME_00005520 [Camellia sinensis var. sinensis]|uniref:phytosulfokines-like n=1 Tax=Camellia sinensis TaxID=4442 RepID=UPI00103598F7|nr:phytosulfokines-like [Camellia sinensis]